MRRRYRKLRRRKHKSVMRNTIIVMIVLTLGFATGYSAFQTNISINAKGNIKEKSRVIRSWTNDSVDDFHNAQYRENIVSITFLDTTTLPSNVEQSWDVSSDRKGGVIAYVKINEDDHTKYDLFIGAKDGVIANENSAYLFYKFSNTASIDFRNNFDTSYVTSMHQMFAGGNKLEQLDLSSFNTARVTTMGRMFTAYNYEAGTWGNKSMKSIIFGDNFNTSNVISMSDMFSGQPFVSLDLSSFNTSSLNSMYSMFTDCTRLTNLNLTNFDTSKVRDMSYMFRNCTQLEQLDLSYFDTSSLTSSQYMFHNCNKLKTIYVSNKFTNTNIQNYSNMFLSVSSIVGGNGTTYDENHIDKEYARIDTATTPGYFTLKQ